MLLLLDLKHVSILESPLDDVGLGRRTLDVFGLVQCRPEFGKILELDVVPDVGQGCLDDGSLVDGGGGGDSARHFVVQG